VTASVVAWEVARSSLGADPTLILGNGASIALSLRFTYDSLFEEAAAQAFFDDGIVQIFKALDTTNFEHVLDCLNTAVIVASANGQDEYAGRLSENIDAIRKGLITTVRYIHPKFGDVRDYLNRYGAELQEYTTVYSFNYDLIVYWAMAERGFAGFRDGFSSNPFDMSAIFGFGADDSKGRTTVYWPHGGLHLVDAQVTYEKDGGPVHGRSAQKLTADGGALLAQFDPSRAQFVSEGRGELKETRISRSDYLRWCLRQLGRDTRPLAIFGTDLSVDTHVTEVIRQNPRPIALSVFNPSSREPGELADISNDAKSRFRASEVVLFDSGSHPLGQLKPS